MTLEDYYSAIDQLIIPKGLSFLEEKKWFLEEREKLRNKLNADDLKKISERSRDWQKKIKSSII